MVCLYHVCIDARFSIDMCAVGAAFWDTGILTFLHLGEINILGMSVPDLPLNEAFMVFGAFGLAFNITTRFALTQFLSRSLILFTAISTFTEMRV